MSKCNRKCGVVCRDAIDLANAIKSDAIKACAEKCAADRADRDFVPKSFWAKLEAEQRTRILSLLPKD